MQEIKRRALRLSLINNRRLSLFDEASLGRFDHGGVSSEETDQLWMQFEVERFVLRLLQNLSVQIPDAGVLLVRVRLIGPLGDTVAVQ